MSSHKKLHFSAFIVVHVRIIKHNPGYILNLEDRKVSSILIDYFWRVNIDLIPIPALELILINIWI